MTEPIKYVDDLPAEAIASIKMLKAIFPNIESKELIETFIYNYNQAKEELKP